MASIYATLSERKLNEENLIQPAGFHDRNTFAVEAMTHYFVTHFCQYVPYTTTEAVLSQEYALAFQCN